LNIVQISAPIEALTGLDPTMEAETRRMLAFQANQNVVHEQAHTCIVVKELMYF